MTTPAHILDLFNWKLTLPVGEPEKPDEHLADELVSGKTWPPFYRVDEADRSVVFRAPVNGVTTSGSGYPRSELREMNGAEKAAWNADDGKFHAMLVELAFTVLPIGKPHVVGAQIHATSDDYSVLRLEGSKLWATLGDNKHLLLTDSYVLGTKITYAFVVGNGRCQLFLNGNLQGELDASDLTKAYFKTGAYTQAKTGQEGVPSSSSNYGEVRVYQVKVTHGARPASVVFPTAPTPTTPVPPPPVEQPPPGTPTPTPVTPKPRPKRVVMVMRHGEKPSDEDDHSLSSKGKARAEALAGLFAPVTGVLREGLYKPDRLIASKGNTASMRMVETVMPLKLRTGLPLNTRYDFEEQESEVGKWLAQRLDITLVCSEHSAIVEMCKNLGKISPGMPKKWPSDRFDVIWVFTSDDGKNWKFTQVPQLLLAGDKSKPIK